MKKVLVITILLATAVSTASAQSTQSALIPSFWGALFNSGTTKERLVPNCTYRSEYNPYSGQTTMNEVCNPNLVTNTSGSAVYNQPTYSQPVNYVQPVSYSQPTYYYSQPQSIPNYFGSNIWYPQNNWGYSDESMFNTYYRGGPSDYTGYYQPGCFADGYCQQYDMRNDMYNLGYRDEFDSPYDYEYQVSSNCGSEYECYQQALTLGRSNGLSDAETTDLYYTGFDGYVPGVNEYEMYYGY